jgi:hypothetical protein
MVLLSLRGELVLAAEVLAKADLEEDEGEILAVEGVWVWDGDGWHYSSGVDDVRADFRSCRHQAAKVFLWVDHIPPHISAHKLQDNFLEQINTVNSI